MLSHPSSPVNNTVSDNLSSHKKSIDNNVFRTLAGNQSSVLFIALSNNFNANSGVVDIDPTKFFFGASTACSFRTTTTSLPTTSIPVLITLLTLPHNSSPFLQRLSHPLKNVRASNQPAF